MFAFSYLLSIESHFSINFFQWLNAIKQYMWTGHFLLNNLAIICAVNVILFFVLRTFHLCSSHGFVVVVDFLFVLFIFLFFGICCVCCTSRFNIFVTWMNILFTPVPRPSYFVRSERIRVNVLKQVEKTSSVLTPVPVLPCLCLLYTLESFLLIWNLEFNEFTPHLIFLCVVI